MVVLEAAAVLAAQAVSVAWVVSVAMAALAAMQAPAARVFPDLAYDFATPVRSWAVTDADRAPPVRMGLLEPMAWRALPGLPDWTATQAMVAAAGMVLTQLQVRLAAQVAQVAQAVWPWVLAMRALAGPAATAAEAATVLPEQMASLQEKLVQEVVLAVMAARVARVVQVASRWVLEVPGLMASMAMVVLAVLAASAVEVQMVLTAQFSRQTPAWAAMAVPVAWAGVAALPVAYLA